MHTIATIYNNLPLLSQRMLADPFETLIQTEDEHSIMEKKRKIITYYYVIRYCQKALFRINHPTGVKSLMKSTKKKTGTLFPGNSMTGTTDHSVRRFKI